MPFRLQESRTPPPFYSVRPERTAVYGSKFVALSRSAAREHRVQRDRLGKTTLAVRPPHSPFLRMAPLRGYDRQRDLGALPQGFQLGTKFPRFHRRLHLEPPLESSPEPLAVAQRQHARRHELSNGNIKGSGDFAYFLDGRVSPDQECLRSFRV